MRPDLDIRQDKDQFLFDLIRVRGRKDQVAVIDKRQARDGFLHSRCHDIGPRLGLPCPPPLGLDIADLRPQALDLL